MEYAIIFMLFMAVLIAAYFYLQRAKARDAGSADPRSPSEPTDQAE